MTTTFTSIILFYIIIIYMSTATLSVPNQVIFGEGHTITVNSPTPSSSITLNLPSTSNDTLVARNTTDTLTNKSIDSGSNTITVGSTNINSLINQDVRTTASPTFGSLNLTIPSNNTFLFIQMDAVGSASLIGTTNEITITQGTSGSVGTFTFSTPQAIGSTSTPTFANIIDSGLTTSTALIANSSQQLTSVSMTDGQLLIGSSAGAPAAANVTVSANLTSTVGHNSIALDTIQPIQTSSSPTFTGLTFSSLTNDNTQTQVLVTNSTTGVIETRASNTFPVISTARYHLATSLSIGSDTTLVVAFDTADVSSTNIMYSTSTPTGVFTIETTGLYTWSGEAVFSSNTTGVRYSWFTWSRSTSRLSPTIATASTSSTNVTMFSSSITVFMTAADTMTFNTYQTTTGSLNVIGSSTNAVNYCNMTVAMTI
jgi:hypothetical protein